MNRDEAEKLLDQYDRSHPVHRLMSHLEINDSACWLWKKGKTTGGYAHFSVSHRVMAYGHKYLFESLYGPVSDGIHIDHLCRVRHCCNPSHLQAVTSKENTLRGIGPSAMNARKTQCQRGHQYSQENTYICRKGKRYCKKCVAETAKRYRIRKKSHLPFPPAASDGEHE